MKAVVVEEYGKAILKDIPLREVGREEVKVKIAYSAVLEPMFCQKRNIDPVNLSIRLEIALQR